MDDDGCRELSFVIFYDALRKTFVVDDEIEKTFKFIQLTRVSFDERDNKRRKINELISVESIIDVRIIIFTYSVFSGTH